MLLQKCMSHGQSQEVKAATPLHKAMEYETTSQWRSSRERTININKHFYVTLT